MLARLCEGWSDANGCGVRLRLQSSRLGAEPISASVAAARRLPALGPLRLRGASQRARARTGVHGNHAGADAQRYLMAAVNS